VLRPCSVGVFRVASPYTTRTHPISNAVCGQWIMVPGELALSNGDPV
jgi:hypothetical protein